MQENYFLQSKKLIYKKSWEISKKYGLDFEEVKSDTFLIFCEALRKFEKDKSKFTTFLFHYLYSKKQNFEYHCQKQKDYNNRMTELSETIPYYDRINKKILFKNLVNLLSNDGQKLINLILKRDVEQNKKRNCGVNFYKIRQATKQKWNWSRGKTQLVFNELKNWFSKNKELIH